MKKNNGKPASVMLATGVMLFNLVACSGGLTETGAFTGTANSSLSKESIGIEISIEDTYTQSDYQQDVNKPDDLELTIPVNEYTTEDVTITTPEKVEVFDLEAYTNYLESLGYLENYFEILLHPEERSDDDLAHAAYLNLKENNLTIEDIKTELHNILVFSQNPTCCTAEEFDFLVGKLYKTLKYEANPFGSYYVLSQRVHNLTCNLEHTIEYGIYTCDTLKQLGEEVRPLSLEEYLDKTKSNNYGYQKIKHALIQNPDHTLDDYLVELNNLLVGQLYPSCVPEDLWYSLYGKLVATLDEYESLYETYIDLAVYIHNTMYPDDQLTQDEYGIYTSRTLKRNDTN